MTTNKSHTDVLTAQAALAAIDDFEIVGENNESREPNDEDRFILTEFIAHAFGGYPFEQHEAATVDARARWKTGTPPTKDGEHNEYIVAVRRAYDKRRVFVFAASHANNYDDELRDPDGNEFIADGWYDIGEDPSGEFNTLFTPTLGPDDEVLGWQELPKWSGATSAQLEPNATNGKQEAAPAEGAIDPTEQLINFSGHSLNLTGAQLLEALDFIAPDRDRDQLESELTFQRGEGHAGNGMYCWVTEYPEEGAIFVDGSTAIPDEVTLTAEEVVALHVLNEKLRYVDDMGPADEGWQSDKLNAAWTAVDAVLARAPFGSETGHARPDARHALTDAARDVLAERRRQVDQEGWTPAHDDQYGDHEMSCAAGCYAMCTLAHPAGDPPPEWPWAANWWKPTTHRQNLVKAGALILASIEQIDRAREPQ
ncbi:hypothetical protein [Burkholderia pseudomallei]|uniref:hypothetical protein n=1 Tax=Burkholderia pseudomallei TaxID=28450 RepID=UPI001F2C9550|nr:hypothetical protein [Burkholderia pseudomallei]